MKTCNAFEKNATGGWSGLLEKKGDRMNKVAEVIWIMCGVVLLLCLTLFFIAGSYVFLTKLL